VSPSASSPDESVSMSAQDQMSIDDAVARLNVHGRGPSIAIPLG
jgi:hypothetical protein